MPTRSSFYLHARSCWVRPRVRRLLNLTSYLKCMLYRLHAPTWFKWARKKLLQHGELCSFHLLSQTHLLCLRWTMLRLRRCRRWVQQLKCQQDYECFAFVDVGGSVQRLKCQQDYGCFAFVDVGGSVQRLKCLQDHLSIYTLRHEEFHN